MDFRVACRAVFASFAAWPDCWWLAARFSRRDLVSLLEISCYSGREANLAMLSCESLRSVVTYVVTLDYIIETRSRIVVRVSGN